MLQDLSPAQVTQALDANRVALWTLFGQLPQVRLHDEPEIRWFETGIRHDVFNRVLQTRLESAMLPASAAGVLDYFQQRRLPFLWHVGPSPRAADLGLLLRQRGLIHHETEPGMAVDLLHYNEDIPTASEVTIHPVTTDALLEQWIRIWEFESDEEVINLWLSFYAGLHLDLQSPLRLYLGTVDGKAAATSAVFFGAGVAAVEYVSTLPDYRRQGIGAAMTLRALQEARRQGYRIGVLTASPMGIRLYRRIGFQEVCAFSLYLWHPDGGKGEHG